MKAWVHVFGRRLGQITHFSMETHCCYSRLGSRELRGLVRLIQLSADVQWPCIHPDAIITTPNDHRRRLDSLTTIDALVEGIEMQLMSTRFDLGDSYRSGIFAKSDTAYVDVV